jgi:three-Cys-motif partner protein
MTKPAEVLWEREEHTYAKHRLLQGYLHAWFPIMADRNGSLNIIDGFAGPGRYTGGEPGSPLLMIDAYVNHRNRTDRMDTVRVAFDFIELDDRRVDYLKAELAKLTLPANVETTVHLGAFDEVMTDILDAIPATQGLAPTFAFIDPFGYTGHSLTLSSRILQFRKCEVLIYVPLPFIARFIDQPELEPALDNLFGDSSWKAARTHRGRDAVRVLHDVFLRRVERAAGHAIAFEIDAAVGKGWAGYTLYFGTSSILGLERMKEAMWRIDPVGGSRFAYSVNPDQMTIFDAAPDLASLEAALRGEFGTMPFSIGAASGFTTLRTPYAPRIHLKKKTLEVAERAGRLEAWHSLKPKRQRGHYPDGTQLRFMPT